MSTLQKGWGYRGSGQTEQGRENHSTRSRPTRRSRFLGMLTTLENWSVATLEVNTRRLEVLERRRCGSPSHRPWLSRSPPAPSTVQHPGRNV